MGERERSSTPSVCKKRGTQYEVSHIDGVKMWRKRLTILATVVVSCWRGHGEREMEMEMEMGTGMGMGAREMVRVGGRDRRMEEEGG